MGQAGVHAGSLGLGGATAAGAHGGVGVGSAARVGGDADEMAGASARTSGQVVTHTKASAKTGSSSQAAENANSGSSKKHGEERAETRVTNSTALKHIDANEARKSGTPDSDKDSVKAGAKVKANTKASVKTGPGDPQ